jgi:hypothetical protein
LVAVVLVVVEETKKKMLMRRRLRCCWVCGRCWREMRSRSQVKAGLSRKWRTTKWVEKGVVGRGTVALVLF